MIAFIEGILECVEQGFAIVNVGGVGYELMVPTSSIDKLPRPGSEVRLYTMLSVNDNTGVSLYGFLSKDDLELFKLIIMVQGVGPKGAQAMLSTLGADTIRYAVLGNDPKTLIKAPGIGNKTAERLILELRDKITLANLPDMSEGSLEDSDKDIHDLNKAKEEAVLALAALGYSRTDALKAVKQVETDENSTVDSILSDSLRFLI